MLQKKIKDLKAKVISEIKRAADERALFDVKVAYLGRKGKLTQILKGLKNLSESERKSVGPLANEARQTIENEIEKRKKEISEKIDWEKEKIDVTLPGKKQELGHLSPITLVNREAEQIFSSMGFEIADGPEMEKDFYNFDSLNIPKDHPARDMMDTFRVKTKANDLLLRTHVSAIQVRYMEKHEPPFRVIMPGRVFRNEATDASHEHTFYQMDGMMVGEDVSAANYYALIDEFLKKFFGKNIKTRMRPSFFPFTEPSFEIDFECLLCNGTGCSVCKQSGWVEIIPGGMINQNVLVAAGYPRNKYQGCAWDIGISRLAMMKYKIDDIRLFQGGDLRFINQF
ncbi:MAG: phenylalanine--tRNA ligase subunit alpha [Candidatus Moranbacteria bacterium]|nr:phenylalanine--tRNA ligase subunit alpha [Candidatus Moranbacteria bacterium]